jgi:predicted HicB family RNase H-like nuclease
LKKKPGAGANDRMTRIRLDDKTHKRLKIMAVREDTSIQKLVEPLILKGLAKSRVKELHSDKSSL